MGEKSELLDILAVWCIRNMGLLNIIDPIQDAGIGGESRYLRAAGHSAALQLCGVRLEELVSVLRDYMELGLLESIGVVGPAKEALDRKGQTIEENSSELGYSPNSPFV